MNNIVYTSITGGKDNLIEPKVPGKFVAFAEGKSKKWQIRPPYDRFRSPRRNSRAPKILAHQFIEADYSLWIDGNLELLKPIDELIDLYLTDHDIAMFKHPQRNCSYEEADACAFRRYDDPEVIKAQTDKYREEGFGVQRGLCEGMFILRRHTPKVEEFNNYWWSEHCRHSVRDQISMSYALDKAGLEPNAIDIQFREHNGHLRRGDIIEIYNHLTSRDEVSI
jgi:hypothetical protein